jgi:hypothetical protein
MTETGMKASFRNYQEREIDLDAGFRSTVARILPYCAPKFKAGQGREQLALTRSTLVA